MCFPWNTVGIDTDSDDPEGCDDADDCLDDSTLRNKLDEEAEQDVATSGSKQELPNATYTIFCTYSSANGIRLVKRD